MSECPPEKTEAELEADVDYMLDTIMSDIKSGELRMSPDAVKQRVMEILRARGMLKGGSRTTSKKGRRSRNKRSTKKKKSTIRRRR